MEIVSKDIVSEFFDKLASGWDQSQQHFEDVTLDIIRNLGDLRGKKVLDVACGTGYMIPYYLQAGAVSVTGIDISSGMIFEAEKKFGDLPNVRLIHGDAECYQFDETYDVCMIYNAFPHFADRQGLIENLSEALSYDGILSVAHGASRAVIDNCHKGCAEHVSMHLPSDDEFIDLFEEYLDVKTYISNDRMIQLIAYK